MKIKEKGRNRYFILDGFEGGEFCCYKFNYKDRSIRFFRKHTRKWDLSLDYLELKELEDRLREITEEEFVLLDL